MNFLAYYTSQFASGIFLTIILLVVSISIGLLLAIGMTACLFSQNRIIKKGVSLLIFFICGTPLLVQIYLIYYGAGQFALIRESSLWFILREPMACAIIALSLNTACYTAVLFNGAIKSVPKNEMDACLAMGMSKWLAFRRVLFPRAFRIALPAYSNEIVMILKSTSLASTITILDLMGVTQLLISQTYQTVTLYIIAGILYLVLNTIIILAFRLMQRYFALPLVNEPS